MRTCPSCGEDNPDRFRLCGFCGAPLHPEPSGLREERKVVSVLFVDLVGFTDRADRADPEDVRAALQPYHALLKREIERFGGTVEKFIGDAVMAVFGAPVAHEDDAERAVRAALRITDAIAELNEESPGLDLAVRGAVNTGEAVVTLGARPEAGEGFVAGDVVNTASRLQGVAPVGGVVVGEGTERATRDQIVYEPLEPVRVKGKAGPVPLWRAVEARSRFGVDVDARPATPFIGRDPELSLLADTFARVVRDRAIQLVTVTGEPGVGKTRLISEFSAHVDALPDLVYWRQGRCLPYGEGIAFWALGEVVKAQAGVLESDGPDEAAEKLRGAVDRAVLDEEEREWVRARLAPIVGVGELSGGGAADRTESFTAWRRFLEGVAATRPLVVVLEDLHWAEPAFMEFVEHLVDWTVDVPLLVVCTARPELYERHPGWGGGKRNSATIALSPLSPEETGRLIAALLEEAVLPAETQAALLERAGGNPLYAEEFVRMLTDQGVLRRRGRAVVLAEGADITVPDSVQALIAARLDTLPADRKALLHDASVIGKVFWSGAVAAIGEVDEGDVRQGLHELARKELVRPARSSSVKGQAEYAFWHALVRDVTYGQLPRSARNKKHRAAARWVEELAGERVADHAELLAHHYTQALDLERASGSPEEVAELEALARRFLFMAARRYRTLDASISVGLLERARALASDDGPERARILVLLGEMLWFTGRIDESARVTEEALAAARRSKDALATGEALLGMAGILWHRGEGQREPSRGGDRTPREGAPRARAGRGLHDGSGSEHAGRQPRRDAGLVPQGRRARRAPGARGAGRQGSGVRGGGQVRPR
ncbi:MAG: AAA family ATPase [Actinobacteria bacterium]|nr:AAA family ATPase [Actinomycetota bacterium]